jgi:hypothetical protein
MFTDPFGHIWTLAKVTREERATPGKGHALSKHFLPLMSNV